jgi:hypothetical protein
MTLCVREVVAMLVAAISIAKTEVRALMRLYIMKKQGCYEVGLHKLLKLKPNKDATKFWLLNLKLRPKHSFYYNFYKVSHILKLFLNFIFHTIVSMRNL